MSRAVDIVFGGQYGSEGKGVIVAALANDYAIHVRVGAPNAGHTFVHKGRTWKMQTIPVGWINPNAYLMIGCGGLINPQLLQEEIEAVATVDPTIYDRLYIDGKCGVLDTNFHAAEGGVNGEMHKRIGSTGEGVGPARAARIARDPNKFRLFRDLCRDDERFARFAGINTTVMLERAIGAGSRIMLEGAQGQGLSLIHGEWPYCTSTDPGPAQLVADVGIPMRAVNRIIAVFRSYPIRVAGASGPLANEITWKTLGERIGVPDLKEYTTVTHKIRRIAEWDDALLKQCVRLHGPTEIALTFADYIAPSIRGITTPDFTMPLWGSIHHIQIISGVKVTLVGTGMHPCNASEYSVVRM